MSVAVGRAEAAEARRRPHRLAALLLYRGRPGFAEIVAYAFVLTIATVLLLGQHVHDSGWYSDDWAYRAVWVQWQHDGFWGQTGNLLGSSALQGRPTLAVYLSLVQALLGPHQGAYLAWAAVLAVVFSLSAYLLLRTLRFRPLDAGLIGLLLLVFPASDSTRIWAMISDAQVAMSFALLGVVCALASVSTTGRKMVAFRVSASVLMVLGVTTYELTFAALLLAFLLYRTRVPWRTALRAGVVDWLTLGATWVLVLRRTTAEHLPLSDAIDHGWLVLKQTFTVFATIALPFASVSAAVVVAVLIVVSAVIVVRTLPTADPTRAALVRWLWTIAIAIAMLVGAYVVYAPSALFYQPLAPGLLNRTNAFGALPMVVLVYALGALLGGLVFRGLRGERGWAAATAAAVALGLGVDYTVAVTRDLKLWDSGWARAHASLQLFRDRSPTPPHRALVVMFGQPIQEAPGVPVWAHYWDLNGALQLTYHDPTLRGRPAFPGTKIECRARAARLTNTLYSGVVLPTDDASYGAFILFDANTGALTAPRNRRECERVATTVAPGPLIATDPGTRDPG